MGRNRTDVKGFALVEAVVVLVLLTAVGLSGYYVYQRMGRTTEQSDSALSETSSHAAKAPTSIKTKTDLNTTESAIDAANLDKDLDSSSLDADLNSLL